MRAKGRIMMMICEYGMREVRARVRLWVCGREGCFGVERCGWIEELIKFRTLPARNHLTTRKYICSIFSLSTLPYGYLISCADRRAIVPLHVSNEFIYRFAYTSSTAYSRIGS